MKTNWPIVQRFDVCAVLLAAMFAVSCGERPEEEIPSDSGVQPAKQDAVEADPRHYKVEFENEHVRILRVSYGPHEKSPMHYHPRIWWVDLTETQFKEVLQDGKATSGLFARKGQGLKDAGTHSMENLLDRQIETIVVEMKDSLPAAIEVDPIQRN